MGRLQRKRRKPAKGQEPKHKLTHMSTIIRIDPKLPAISHAAKEISENASKTDKNFLQVPP